MGSLKLLVLALAAALFLMPAPLHAQASITGVVKDSSGAVLPGVTVEASSEALIEKVRAVITDGAGTYRIVDLRPGTYVVTFSLPGFSTVKREGLELTGSFAATVNGELRVGAVAETITVTGESPVVDIQNVTQQRVLSKDVIDALPAGRAQFALTVLIPGINTNQQDVGGTNSMQLQNISIHGGRINDTRTLIDGLPSGNMEQNGQLSNFLPDMGAAQEVTIDYASGSAEQSYGGPRVNLVPREGGNTFRGSFFATAVNGSFQGDNYTQDLKDRGLRTPNIIDLIYDINPGGGGPILEDRLWFYTSARWQANKTSIAGMFENLNAGNLNAWAYLPDTSRPGIADLTQWSGNGRLTFQASARNKFTFYHDQQGRAWHQVTATVAPESANDYSFPVNRMTAFGWSAPLTNRVLVEARTSFRGERYVVRRPGVDDPFRLLIPVTEQAGLIAGLLYRGSGQQNSLPFFDVYGVGQTALASLSFVTGTHALKVGFTNIWGGRDVSVGDNDHSLSYRFNNGVPNLITMRATPYEFSQRVKSELGVYAQDKWTIDRLTVNAGIRFDYYNTYHPGTHLGPAPLVPTRDVTFPETAALNFKDVTPRLGLAYDVTGSGKTAVKVTLNKYVIANGLQGVYGDLTNPVRRLASQVTRSWNDSLFPAGDPRRQNYKPDCDLLNPLLNGECGVISDLNFGKAAVSTSYDPATLNGWGRRPNNWEFSTSVQQEILPRVSVDVGYFRRWYGNFTVTDNRAVAPTDYSVFSIVAPVDPRLPEGGGYAIGGLYDLNQNRVGAVDNYFTMASNFGDQIEHWNGVDATINARLRQGVVLQGGVSTGRTSTDNCDVVVKVDNPSPLYCHVDTAFLTQVKFLGAYTIPKVDLQVSGTFQSVPGPPVSAIYNAPNALVAPSLGRPLSAGAANAPVNLIEPGALYGERLNQLDLRVAKIFRFGRNRAALNLDFYNALNSAAVLTQNNNYASWLVPQSILLARFAKISAQFDF